MNTPPCATTLWILDHDRKHLTEVSEQVAGRFPTMRVETFNDAEKASVAFRQTPPEHYPWLLVTDHVGVSKPPDGGLTVRQIARRYTPLTLVNLHAASAFLEADLVTHLIQQQEIDAVIPRGQLSKLLDTISDWHHRWNLPVMVRLREYLATEEAHVPFVTCADGEDVSLLDVHREIVLGTPQGKTWAKAWEMVFSNKPLTDLFPELTH